jgi:hypothetical protein
VIRPLAIAGAKARHDDEAFQARVLHLIHKHSRCLRKQCRPFEDRLPSKPDAKPLNYRVSTSQGAFDSLTVEGMPSDLLKKRVVERNRIGRS